MMNEKSIVGDLINFRGLVYAPVNENGVVFLFGKVADDLNMYIEEIKPGFPDCIGRRFVGKGWERIAIEFEYRSSNFQQHGHDPKNCDVIGCWEHDWKECPLEVIELKSEIQALPNYLIKRPGATEKQEKDVEKGLTKIYDSVSATIKVKEWYELVFDGASKTDDRIWAKVGTKYVGWYCPERAFVSIRIRKTSILVECFSRGLEIPGTKVANEKYAPRWVRFTIKSDADVQKATEIIAESYKRIRDAIAAGEPTNYFSGGEGSGDASMEIEKGEEPESEAENG
jgi:hypothetical protein